MSRRFQGPRLSRRMPGGGVIVSPLTIFGNSLELWLRADLGITLNGSDVSAWADQSGSSDNGGAGNHHPAQGTAANQPPYNSSDAGYGGQPTLSFTGTRWLFSPVWTTAPTTVGTFFIVCNFDGTATGAAALCFNNSSVGTLYQTVGNDLRYYQGTDLIIDTASTRAAKHIWGVDRNGASSNVYEDNVTAIKSGNPNNLGLNRIMVGSFDPVGTAPLIGTVAEIISVNRLATTAERTATMKYLGARYGITVGA